ncbi:MAG: ATP-binding protein [Desulfitobacteriia bacterium]|jgi:PAS domain S-box-containing protein
MANRNNLTDSLEKYKILVEYSRDIILFVKPDGQIIEANRAAEIAYGYSREELRKLLIFDLRVDESRIVIHEQMQKALSEGILFETYHKRKDGTVFPIEVSSRGEILPDGPVILSIVRDISKRKQMEEQLARSNKIKSQFLANISHEIRTPLNGILGMLDLVLADNCEDPQEYLRMARDCTHSLIKVFNDILDYKRLGTGKLQIINKDIELATLLREVTELFGPLIRQKNLTISCTIQPDVPAVIRADNLRLRQVISNLVSNAVKFTQQGSIDIAVNLQEKNQEKVILHFTIADTGIGIPAEKMEEIFLGFTQGDGSYTREYGGVGLGLTICKQLVAMMGGTIWVESSPGSGSKFHFTIAQEKEKKSYLPSNMAEIDLYSEEVLRDVITELTEKGYIRQIFQEIEKGLQAGNYREVARQAHKLKGCFSYFQVESLDRCAHKFVEISKETEKKQTIWQAYRDLILEYETLEEALLELAGFRQII